MADKKKVTFSMGLEDLEFLIWAMGTLKGGKHGYDARIEHWEKEFDKAEDDYFPAEENLTVTREPGAPKREGSGVSGMLSRCSTCGTRTYHQSEGGNRQERESDGRVF